MIMEMAATFHLNCFSIYTPCRSSQQAKSPTGTSEVRNLVSGSSSNGFYIRRSKFGRYASFSPGRPCSSCHFQLNTDDIPVKGSLSYRHPRKIPRDVSFVTDLKKSFRS